MRIVRITATEVIVRAHPGALESPGLNKPLHKIPEHNSNSWTRQFDECPKVVLELQLTDGTTGLGELYRGHEWATVAHISAALLGQDVRDMFLQGLPFTKVPEHDGFEIALWDAFAKLHGLRVVDLLGGPVRDRVLVGAWSGQRRDDEVGPLARHYQQQGFTCLKFTCALDDDIVARCTAIAEAAPGMDVILDPNECFEQPHETRRLAAQLADIGNVLCLEDPMPHWMRADYAQLCHLSPVPIVRHFALPYPVPGNHIEDVITAAQNHEADGFNFSAGLADFQRLDHITDVRRPALLARLGDRPGHPRGRLPALLRRSPFIPVAQRHLRPLHPLPRPAHQALGVLPTAHSAAHGHRPRHRTRLRRTRRTPHLPQDIHRAMTTPANPFPNDPDRHALWDMLLRRDAEGFTAAWSCTSAGDASRNTPHERLTRCDGRRIYVN